MLRLTLQTLTDKPRKNPIDSWSFLKKSRISDKAGEYAKERQRVSIGKKAKLCLLKVHIHHLPYSLPKKI